MQEPSSLAVQSTQLGAVRPPAIEQLVPKDESKFVDMVAYHTIRYGDASNEFQKSTVRRQRAEEIARILPDRSINDWIGQISSMETTSDGRGVLSVKIPGSADIHVETMNNGLSDIGADTLIPQRSPVYGQVASLAVGDDVIFSGRFVARDLDYIEEISITEEESMTSPEFVFTFASVLKETPGIIGNNPAASNTVSVDAPSPKAPTEPEENANPNVENILSKNGNHNDPVDVYSPCIEATQHLQVPDQINLDNPHDLSSFKEPRPNFTFLFSEQGIDVYAVRTNKFGPEGYHRLALLVFQEEKIRRAVLRSYIASGLVTWAYSDVREQDWKPIVNFKYVTLDFTWSQRQTGWEPSVGVAKFYAPQLCDSVSNPPGARPSSMIGIYINATPSDLPPSSLRYRAAQAMRKFQIQEGSK